ncbi:MAG: radical SAM protein, partial [Candidatus Thorarchaeota archaeon]
MSIEQNKRGIPYLTFLISYKCTNECKHCALQGSPHQDNSLIELGDVRRYLDNVTSNYVINEVGFFGGEPLLHFKLLINLIQEVKKHGITKIGLPTNGYWGKSEKKARDYALKLRNAGLYRIGFSVDAFHQEFIPLDVLRNAIKASHEAGIEWIALMAKNLRIDDKRNVFNDRTKKITDTLSKEFEFCEVINSEVLLIGRATSQLTEHFSVMT